MIESMTLSLPQIRSGMTLLNFPGLENLFYNYGVDLVLAGHNHHYERSLPVYNKQILVSDANKPYHNAKAPVYIITGVPGNQEIRDQGEQFSTTQYPWSVFKDRHIGYMRMEVVNETHLHMQQIAAEKVRRRALFVVNVSHSVSLQYDEVIDDIWLSKSRPSYQYY